MKKCDKCGFEGEFITEDYGLTNIIFCPDCYFHSSEACKHEKNNLVQYTQNGRHYVRKLCTQCNTLFDSFVKQSGLHLNSIRTIDKNKYDRYLDELSEKITKRINALSDYYNQWAKKTWLKDHDDYLKTMEWQERRDEVLKRDGYLCQSCRKSRAIQVHHLNYKHWKNEPLFELVSVCSECHEMITRLDQKDNLYE